MSVISALSRSCTNIFVGIGLVACFLVLIFLNQVDQKTQKPIDELTDSVTVLLQAVDQLQDVQSGVTTGLTEDFRRANKAERELNELRARAAAGNDPGVNYYEPLAAPTPVEADSE